MIELHSDRLIFTFPDFRADFHEQVRAWVDSRAEHATSEEKAKLPSVHWQLYRLFAACVPDVRGAISFQRTLRIPDDGRDYPLPPGLGRFPICHVDDFASVSETWKKRGGVMLPMHKTEALWLHFESDYPMALKVGVGGICAISGERWASSLRSAPQNYAVLPHQPWLDGFRISREVVRQFVAIPLGHGLTVEHQLTGEESWGGLQLQAFPFRTGEFWSQRLRGMLERKWRELVTPPHMRVSVARMMPAAEEPDVGLGAGGRMKQEIVADPHGVAVWDISQISRCFVHLCLADDWQRLTGTQPPQQPPTAADYAKAGLPWFVFDDGQPSVAGETALSGVKTVSTLAAEKIGLQLHDSAPVVTNVVRVQQNHVAASAGFKSDAIED